MGDFVKREGLRLAGLVLVALLFAAIVFESYYVAVLRERMDAQTEELRSLSFQLQSSKSESAELREELTSIKKLGGEKKDGDTVNRQH